MSGGIEAGADLVTAGLYGRAVEPSAGEALAPTATGTICLNCGTALVGAHCHRCGQSGHVHRTFGAIGHDIAHGVFHFEGKAWRTLPMLALRPGELTRRYVAGERARFVSPIAVFLFSVFLMFTVVANLPGWTIGGDKFFGSGVSQGLQEAQAKLAQQQLKAGTALREAQADLAEERRDTEPDVERITRLQQRVATNRKAASDLAAAQAVLPKATDFNVKVSSSVVDANWLDQKWRHAKENPKLLIYKVKTSAYKYSWALIPLSLPFIWILFPFSRRFGFYDHAVFTTYSLTFMSLLVVVLALLGAVGVNSAPLIVAATLIPPIHIYKQLKGAYRLGRFSALARTALLSGFITCLIVPLFALMLLYLGVGD